jgi:hypothetical protein
MNITHKQLTQLWSSIRKEGKLIQTAKTKFGADIHEHPDFPNLRAFLLDEGYTGQLTWPGGKAISSNTDPWEIEGATTALEEVLQTLQEDSDSDLIQ